MEKHIYQPPVCQQMKYRANDVILTSVGGGIDQIPWAGEENDEFEL